MWPIWKVTCSKPYLRTHEFLLPSDDDDVSRREAPVGSPYVATNYSAVCPQGKRRFCFRGHHVSTIPECLLDLHCKNTYVVMPNSRITLFILIEEQSN